MKDLVREVLLDVEIDDFITKIQTSKARKPIYYEYNGKYPVPSTKSKHIAPNGNKKYVWLKRKIGTKIKTILCYNTEEFEPVLKNSRSAGKPRYLAIKGNNIYSGFGGYRNRVIIINSIKDSFRPYFTGKKIANFPIYLTFTFYDELNLVTSTDGNQTQDLDNLSTLYVKAVQDLMKSEGVIPDDNLVYIRKLSVEFIESTNKKLAIKAFIYKK